MFVDNWNMDNVLKTIGKVIGQKRPANTRCDSLWKATIGFTLSSYGWYNTGITDGPLLGIFMTNCKWSEILSPYVFSILKWTDFFILTDIASKK